MTGFTSNIYFLKELLKKYWNMDRLSHAHIHHGAGLSGEASPHLASFTLHCTKTRLWRLFLTSGCENLVMWLQPMKDLAYNK